MVPDSVQLTLSCAGGGGWCSGDSSDPFPYREPPPNSWVSREKKGGGRREARGGVCARGHQMVFTAYCAAFITLTHKYRNVQSQELGLEVDFWPLGRRPRPDCAVLLARLAKPGLSWTPIAVFF